MGAILFLAPLSVGLCICLFVPLLCPLCTFWTPGTGLPAFLLFPTFPTFSYFLDSFLLFPTFFWKTPTIPTLKKIKSAKNISVILLPVIFAYIWREDVNLAGFCCWKVCKHVPPIIINLANHKFIIWITSLFHTANRMVWLPVYNSF